MAELIPVDSTTATISGVTKVTAVEGIYVFDNFKITADPGQSINVYI
jgi:hypothetical protein